MSEGDRLVCPAWQVVQSGWLPGHLLGRSIWTRADYEDNDLLWLQRQGAYVRRGVRYMRWFREDTGSSGTVSSRGDGREAGEGVGGVSQCRNSKSQIRRDVRPGRAGVCGCAGRIAMRPCKVARGALQRGGTPLRLLLYPKSGRPRWLVS